MSMLTHLLVRPETAHLETLKCFSAWTSSVRAMSWGTVAVSRCGRCRTLRARGLS